eukprot:CAMPEP_0201734406 /NCGR_PEP_ID=MMETSP0593-20130828/34178_1 /ASSEMBLY_ACC=CAM_ASM_000672 /TAXON_ID=267983 /ORGANISM="Skeletonema japonicum, Strain CCMP2506" /LENGTH=65 /DNA_ID=CAMNT_0048227721 /DNA_START=28 /DNA_END=221 /DNA_ORIENTATION=+
MVVGGDGGVNEEYEYNDNDDNDEEENDNDAGVERQGGTVLSPIAAVTCLGGTNGTTISGDGVARV